MNDLMLLFFLVSAVVAVGVIVFGVSHLIARAGDDRENALWVARGVLILALIWLIQVL